MGSKALKYFLYFYIGLIVLFLISIGLKTMRRKQNEAALDGNANIRAFLKMIRPGESSTDDSIAYRMLFGGSLFNDYSRHPNKLITKGGYSSTAAGAYQFLFRTWDRIQKKLGLPDFSPRSQDLGAIELLRERGVYGLIVEGRIEEAINGWNSRTGANKEWASLPNSPYGQPMKTMAQVINYYKQFGGTLA